MLSNAAAPHTMPIAKQTADNEATRLLAQLGSVEAGVERALQVAHRIHERLYGPEPRSEGPTRGQVAPAPTNGLLAMAAGNLHDVDANLGALNNILTDVELRLST